MDKVLEILLAVVIVGATLAFGGVQPLTYSLVELALFFAVVLLLIQQSRRGRIDLPFPLWPAIFVLWAAIAVIPLPSSIPAFLSPARLAGSNLSAILPGYGGWSALSINPHSTVEALLKLLAYLSAFILAAYLFDSRKRKSLLTVALIVLGCFEASYGIFQYMAGSNKIFGYANTFDAGNAFGTYINRNHFAGLLEMTLPFVVAAIYYSLHKRSPRSNSGRRPSPGGYGLTFEALFYAFMLAILGVALVFSRSRGGILAVGISIVFVVLLGQVKDRRKGWTILVVLCMTAVVGYGLWIGLQPVLTRFELMGQKNFLEMEGRPTIWRNTLHLLHDFPLTGSGLGTFATAYKHYQTTLVTSNVDHAHNDYLEFASETGWPGLALLFIPIFYLFVRMVAAFLNDSHRYRRSILLGCIGSSLALLIHSFTDFNLQVPANALIFAVILGIGYKASCLEPPDTAMLPESAAHPRF